MTQVHRAAGLALALTSATAAAAHADVTPAEVWESWRAAYAAAGVTVTPGSEQSADGTLTLTDVAFSASAPDTELSGSIPRIVLDDNGDGTVTITMSPDYSLRVQTAPAEGPATDMHLDVATTDMALTASGTPDAITYAYVMPRLTLDIADRAEPGSGMRGTLTIEDGKGTSTLSATDSGHSFAYDLAAARLRTDLTVTPPDQPGGKVDMTLSYADLAAASEGDLGAGLSLNTGTAALPEGATVSGTVRLGAGELRMTVADPENGETRLTSASESGSLDFANEGVMVNYQAASEGVTFALSGDSVPVPEVGGAARRVGFTLRAPMGATPNPRDLELGVELAGLTLSDSLWSMVDPESKLSHEPATLQLDLSGKGRLLRDPSAAPETPGAPPAEIQSLDLNRLMLDLLGARLDGSGSFSFDNSAPGVAPGLPAADGSLDLKLTGAMGLLDTLVQMGFVAQNQAAGARLMLGLFTTPAGEDTVTSKIEVTRDGAISANGQRLK
ncbi:DUF2125 domain-containing protein [Oceaniglobus roseus]|uniref:DUF2125 domain-containing protein n=1 Tax=Oceaniglobus roseus TaxID=1737570 RepID=UPI000C7F306E|nr:DUF2125 domain-containing protein [Kandeliimicrobium roseum]